MAEALETLGAEYPPGGIGEAPFFDYFAGVKGIARGREELIWQMCLR